MPSHTPSPHRFLAPNPPSVQKSKAKPQSSLRNALALQTPNAKPATLKSQPQFQKLTPAKRFVIAPTRHKSAETPGKGKEREDGAWADTRTQFTPLPKPRRKFERVESIEEAQSSPAGQDEGHPDGVVHSIEHEARERDQEANEDEEDEILFETTSRIKRRRISPSASPSLPRPPSPQTSILPHNLTTHRFRPPAPRTLAPFPSIATAIAHTPTPATKPAHVSHRPHFILPALPTSPAKPSKPLPEIFSPSRQNGKYIPHGLASTVTSWIIETANTGFAAQERSGVVWGREREDGVKMRVRISGVSRGGRDAGGEEEGVECYAGGVVFVRGDTEREKSVYNASRAPSVAGDEGETRFLLAGQGGARGTGGVKIKTGCVIGLRAPMWHVHVGEEKWVVGVDWVVL
ncbi:hypothetical protein EJ02DRAFT_435152 [Clathrospora elynae]|uniref:Uncharacterized protein n=1 Tax=Clathrospora elynae TaxID=706981 RepID=A0A6A5SNG3_9PLEO|nr:hypothetical protein EJ02DRAFT_435152 [Clathrospora elynae]